MQYKDIFIFFIIIFYVASCNNFSYPPIEDTRGVQIYFSDPGTRDENGLDPIIDDIIVNMIDNSKSTLDIAVMSFGRENIIDAVVRAYYRGVKCRLVGDSEHLIGGDYGYTVMMEHHIPMVVGNENHIMHNKFFIIDKRWVITGSSNMSDTSFENDMNNYAIIDSPQVAKDFTDEFEQMFAGRFGNAKKFIDNGNTYRVGDTIVEVYFSPHEDAMGKILEYTDNALSSIHFFIFAFTKDQVGSSFINKHREFLGYENKEIKGVLDKSQLHGNGPYHEVYRLTVNGLSLKKDGNENTSFPGDYQRGGGRLHHKTMIIDVNEEEPKVVTGSFNWSASATISNDETLLVFHGKRVASLFKKEFDRLWRNGTPLDGDNLDIYNGFPDREDVIHKGSIIINEIHWDGWNGLGDPSDHSGDIRPITNDEFIELKNMTDKTIDISFWSITTESDVVIGFVPKTFIKPNQVFFVVDHNIEPFNDINPQSLPHAFQNPDYVLNLPNDPRFPRLNIKNSGFKLFLKDNRGNIIDIAGDGGPPFFGGRDGDKNYSMERNYPPQDGTLQSSWHRCNLEEGGKNVTSQFRNIIIATPGEENSEK